MPKGFVGPPAVSYLPTVEEALEVAARAHHIDPFANLRNRFVPPPPLPFRPNEDSPHPASTAMLGANPPGTGVGNVRNIVTDEDIYFHVIREVCEIDENFSDLLFHLTNEVAEICNTSYVLPQTVPRILEMSSAVALSLGDFRFLTNLSILKVNSFKNEVLSVK